jgi:hypothetical protein
MWKKILAKLAEALLPLLIDKIRSAKSHVADLPTQTDGTGAETLKKADVLRYLDERLP